MFLSIKTSRITEIIIHIYRYSIHKYLYGYQYFGSRIAIGKDVKVNNASSISVESYVHLQDNVWLNALPTKRLSIVIKEGCDIGRNTFISSVHSITLESNVLIAPNVFISDHSHKYALLSKPISHQGITKPKPVHIGAGSWIGINAVILPGTTIGKHSIVAANSVVKGKIPAYSIVAGTPAKVVKSLK
jgi:acetyltransferase-like isoleucine patch superfamily enzyme